MSAITFLASPANRGAFVSVDGEQETRICLNADATQLAAVLPLVAMEKGTLLRVTVEVAE